MNTNGQRISTNAKRNPTLSGRISNHGDYKMVSLNIQSATLWCVEKSQNNKPIIQYQFY